jgi:DNA-binding FrmR family transcriptional regulator
MDHCSRESKKALDTLKTARGQIDGIIRMIEEDRYCIDVSKQILSATALLKKANITILRRGGAWCRSGEDRRDRPHPRQVHGVTEVAMESTKVCVFLRHSPRVFLPNTRGASREGGNPCIVSSIPAACLTPLRPLLS